MGMNDKRVQDLPRSRGSLADVRCGTNPSREGRRRREAQNMTNDRRLILHVVRKCLPAWRTIEI